MKEFKIGDRVEVLDFEEMKKQEGVSNYRGTITTTSTQSPGFVTPGMEHLCGETGVVTDTEYFDGTQIRVHVYFDNDVINWQAWHYAPFMFKKIKEAKAGFDDLPELSSLYGGVYED